MYVECRGFDQVAAPEHSSSMGPVLYFGLIGVALIGASPAPVDYLNPQKTMKDVSFDGAPEDITLYDTFSWPIATQNVDASLVKVALLSIPQAVAAPTSRALHEAAVRPPLDGYLPVSFSDPAVPVSFRPTPTIAPMRMQAEIQGPSSLVPRAPANLDFVAPQLASTRPELGGFLPETFEEPLGPVGLAANQTATPSRENHFHNARNQPPIALIAAPQDIWLGQPDAPWFSVTTGDRVYLRAEPALAGEPLDLIPISTNVTVTQIRGDWLRIEVDGKTGWMFAEFVAAP